MNETLSWEIPGTPCDPGLAECASVVRALEMSPQLYANLARTSNVELGRAGREALRKIHPAHEIELVREVGAK